MQNFLASYIFKISIILVRIIDNRALGYYIEAKRLAQLYILINTIRSHYILSNRIISN